MENIRSCGVILTDGKKLLAIKPYGKLHMLDIPKGKQERGETDAQTAARELQEETGLRVQPDMLKHVGVFHYLVNKDISLFVYKAPSLPPLESLRCTSFFKNDYGRRVPEAVGYVYTTFDNPTFYRKLQPILQKIGKLL